MKPDFVHLHVHSDYSILDGACKIHELLDRCEKYGMKACALTDHGNMFGAIEFYQSAKKRGIKPIIGCELYVAPGDRTDTKARFKGATNNHFLLLCENETGYHNLCRLSTLGYLEGFYYKPRVDDALLAKYKDGLIATTSCLAGRIPQAILQNDVDAANAQMQRYIEIFGKDNFLVELMCHDLPEQNKVNPILAQMAEDHGLMTIATNDCHYIDKSDAEAHEALLCIQTGTTLDDEGRFKFPNNEFYFRTGEEMVEKFPDWHDAIANTAKVAARCNVEIPLNLGLIPAYRVPDGMPKEDYLEELVAKGLEARYGAPPPPECAERAQFELRVIEEMKFVDYFLVVWDLIHFARGKEIPVGPGRGSGAGSIVAYALQITNIDPMRYGLLFERFLNPDRSSMPDFDIDFCYNRREEVIQYAYQKYGRENVSQIITFGRLLAKNVMGRVMGMPYPDVDRIAKLVPDELKITLAAAADKEPELKRLIKEDPEIARLWKLAGRLEGTIGNCGTHAAGVVICDHALTDHVALFKAANSDTVATQAEMKCVEEVGLLKMDFLGLRTLTVVHDAVRNLKETRGIEIDIDNIEPDDAKTYALLRSGNTTGIFQLESSGMRDLAKRIGLESLEEMSALVALYRPGPMQFIDTYVENKHHAGRIKYDHPLLEPILKETYGIAIYQEQVMKIVQAVAGFSLGRADILRRAMGKKKADLMAAQREKFVEGCKANGIGAGVANPLFAKIETFAGYGFNKSHSVAYAYVAYQTAYLKANYPEEFMCALLTSEAGNLDKVAVYVEECRRLNIKVLPPDINKSYTGFTVKGGAIHFGLGAIKNVGAGPTEAIVADRVKNGPYKDIYDFCNRLDTRQVNHRLIESLNKAGAFGGTGWNRRAVASVIEMALKEGQSAQRDREAGQTSLFDISGMEETVEMMHQKPDLEEWPQRELLSHEREVLGLYASSHPLEEHAETLRRFHTVRLADLNTLKEGEEVNLGGLVSTVRTHLTKRGKMAFVGIETLEGACEVTVFSDKFEQKGELLVPESLIMVAARVNYRNNSPGLVANDIYSIDDTELYFTRALHVRLDAARQARGETVERVAKALGARPGNCDVFLHCHTNAQTEVVVLATRICRIAPSPELLREVEAILGPDSAWYSAGIGMPTHTPRTIKPPETKPWQRKSVAV